MILLCGVPSEQPLAMVEHELQRIGAPYVWFDQRRFDEMAFRFCVTRVGVDGCLRVGSASYDLGAVTGVYTRLMDDRLLPGLRGREDTERARRCRGLHSALLHWCEISPARVINRTATMASNSSKPYQAQIIREAGFLVPETLVTNAPELVRQFRECHGQVIYKSISGTRSIVQLLDDRAMDRLDRIRWCSAQFQEFVDGTNVRVHVVGDEVIATAIRTPAIDYRYAAREGAHADLTPTRLADDLASRCILLARSLGLEFAGVDLKITADGRVFCFEVNPSPGFSYFEISTGQEIALAVALHLLNGKPEDGSQR